MNGQSKSGKDNNGMNGVNGYTPNSNNVYAPIVNDGIKPKIIIHKAKDDHADSQYANAGFDEILEAHLRKESEKRKEEEKLLKQK